MNKSKEFIKLLNEKQITSEHEYTKEFIRVKLTYNYIQEKNIQLNDISSLFDIMKEATYIKLGYFPGDDEFFYSLYNVGKDIDIIEFMKENYSDLKKIKPLLPEALTKYANESIEDETIKNILITDVDRINPIGIKEFIESNKDKKITLISEIV